MCGLGAISLSRNSQVNARMLAHNLFAELEFRGNQASGFAYSAERGVGYDKAAVAGSQFKLSGLPREARTVILHTRFATHGVVQDDRNNHPVISPNATLALAHNGVIWNHEEVRYSHLRDVDLPDVDSSVIGALIEQGGVEMLDALSGDAAIAWLVKGEAETLNIARLESSPMSYTQLLDGSMVFASTEYLLIEALKKSNLEHGAIRDMEEGEYFKVVNGIIMETPYIPGLQSFSDVAWWRNATSGGHGSESGTKFVNRYDKEADMWDYVEEPLEQPAITTGRGFSQAMALEGGNSDEYYTVDQWGNYKTYANLDALENDLKWHAGLMVGDSAHYQAEGLARWVEHFIDVGSLDLAGKEMVSWVDDPSESLYHEDANGDGLEYIRDGISYLTAEIGR